MEVLIRTPVGISPVNCHSQEKRANTKDRQAGDGGLCFCCGACFALLAAVSSSSLFFSSSLLSVQPPEPITFPGHVPRSFSSVPFPFRGGFVRSFGRFVRVGMRHVEAPLSWLLAAC